MSPLRAAFLICLLHLLGGTPLWSSTKPVDLRILAPDLLCIVIDQTSAVQHAREDTFGTFLARLSGWLSGPSPAWKKEKTAYYRLLSVLSGMRLPLVSNYENPERWTVNGVPVSKAGYWPQSIDGFPESGPDFVPFAAKSAIPRIADYIYLKPSVPLSSGPVRVENLDGVTATLDFCASSTLCWSLKVNQVGYLASAPRKIAYLGMWAGPLGPVDFSPFAGEPFYLVPAENGTATEFVTNKPVFTGVIRLRSPEKAQRYKGIPITGEDVYELDFSACREAGRFRIVVPGLGCSRPFRISNDIYGGVFFTAMRALYHQRCGIDLSDRHTAWARKACHARTFRGEFPPELPATIGNWYDNGKYDPAFATGRARSGFRDTSGQPLRIGPFGVIRSTTTDTLVPGLSGGWHDAADYDRRIFHYDCVFDLCGVYELFPQKFRDGQLNIPESGNGIPDILDEAAVQIDLFRKTQTPEGGISGWIEQTSHPPLTLPSEDASSCYVSLPERNSSLIYAASAAYLGRLLKPFAPASSSVLIESARRAYGWGLNPANSIRNLRFEYQGRPEDPLAGKTILFDQPDDLPGTCGKPGNLFQILAAAQLYAATGETSFLEEISPPDAALATLQACFPDAIQPFALVTFLLKPDILGREQAARLLRSVETETDAFLDGQAALPYRNLWRKPDHPYFSFMSWGAIHGGRRARFPLLLWRLTGDSRYLDAALLGLDWELGGNEMGRSLVTGLGSVYPMVLQHTQSETDDLLEPVPGIPVFTFTFGVAPQAITNLYALIDEGHPSVSDFFPGTAVCLLPGRFGRQEIQNRIDDARADPRRSEIGKNLISERLDKVFPIFRRTYSHPFVCPAQNEFTVSESISPLAAAAGALLTEEWQPDARLLQRRPCNTAADTPLYYQP